MRVATYARVSTDDQTTTNQALQLQAIANQRGWTIVRAFTDEGISGSKGRDKRPGFDQLQRAAVRGEFDLIAVWSIDRIGRSMQHLVAFLSEIQAANVGLYVHVQALDTTTPSGRAMFQMLGVFAEFERALMIERVKAGLARARAQGKKFGRKPVSPGVVAQIVAAPGDESNRAVARRLGLSEFAVRQYRKTNLA